MGLKYRHLVLFAEFVSVWCVCAYSYTRRRFHPLLKRICWMGLKIGRLIKTSQPTLQHLWILKKSRDE